MSDSPKFTEHELKLIVSALYYKALENKGNAGARQFEELAERIEKEAKLKW